MTSFGRPIGAICITDARRSTDHQASPYDNKPDEISADTIMPALARIDSRVTRHYPP